jgi:cell division septation protein DedD
MYKEMIDYLKEKMSKVNSSNESQKTEKKSCLKNKFDVVKKPLIISLTVLTMFSMLTGCGKVDDRYITSEEGKGINFQTVSQEKLDANRWFGSLFGLDRGNLVGDYDNVVGDGEVIDVTPKPVPTPDTTVTPEIIVTPDVVPTPNPTPNTSITPDADVKPKPVPTPEVSIVTPAPTPNPTPNPTPKPEPEIIVPSQNNEADGVLNNFDIFVQTYLMITGQNATNAKFVSLNPTGAGYSLESGFSPTIQPNIDFSSQVYTGTITVNVNGQTITIDNIAIGVNELQSAMSVLGTQTTSNISISRDMIKNAGNSQVFQNLLDSIVSANANCIEPDMADGM